MWRKFIFIGLCLFFFQTQIARADYNTELEGQINDLKTKYTAGVNELYFHDMGILAKKADDTGLNELSKTIVRSLLLERMDRYVKEQIDGINELYLKNSAQASEQLTELMRFRKYYEPNPEFLSTAAGTDLAAELSRARQRVLEMTKKSCSSEQNIKLIAAFRKTGLFFTNTPEEINAMRDLTESLNCCLHWRKKLEYHYTEAFETDYDAGNILEDAVLTLESNPIDLNQARWAGTWKYTFEGRDGRGTGDSKAALVYRKGEETTQLTISAAKMNSIGRINLPMTPAGEQRNFEIEGDPIYPEAVFTGEVDIPLIGCREKKAVEKK